MSRIKKIWKQGELNSFDALRCLSLDANLNVAGKTIQCAIISANARCRCFMNGVTIEKYFRRSSISYQADPSV